MFTMRSAVRHGRRGRARDGRRGQALAEFAMVVPIFLLIVAGMIDFGLGLYTYVTMANGARDGVRLAATTCDVSSLHRQLGREPHDPSRRVLDDHHVRPAGRD